MIATPPQATTSALTDEIIAARIQGYVDHGMVPFVAAERVIRDICAEGLAVDLLALLGPASLFEVWQTAYKPRRSGAGSQPASVQGRRRVDLDVLNRAGSLMEALFEINGQWIKIGDMTVLHLKRAAAVQKLVALQRAQYARWFHALGQRVPAGQTVRQALDEAALARLFDEAAPR